MFRLPGQYEYQYDHCIAKALFKYEQLGHRELKEKIESQEYLNKTISPDTFNYHLKRMKKHGYIKQKKSKLWKRGQTTPFCLTRRTKQEIELDILQISYSDDNNNKDHPKTSFSKLNKQKLKKQYNDNAYDEIKETRKKIIQMILTVQTTKAHTPFPDNDYFQYPNTISINDIMNGVSGIVHFWYLNFKLKREQVQDAFEILEKEKILTRIITTENGPRYIISEPNIEKFVIDCLKIRDSLISFRFHFIWKNLRNPSPEEREYFEYYNGKEYTDRLFNDVITHLRQKRKVNKDNSEYKTNLKTRRKLINDMEDMDYNIYEYGNEIKRKYKRLFKKYPILKKMFFESIYTSFVRREIEKTVKKKMKVKGKWIKKPHIGISFVTPWGSRQAPKTST